MRRNRFLSAILIVLLALSQIAFAEQAYVDLEDRFSHKETYEYGGAIYYLKNRVKTTLVMCANLSDDPETGVGSVELILLLPIDDDSKIISPIQLDENMLAGWLEGEDRDKTLGQLFAEAESTEAACERLVEAMNELFPSPVVDQYAVFDLRGLPALDGIENDEVNVAGEALIERMKAIKRQIEQDDDVNVNAMLKDMSGYIITDMKSGAMMKVVDKADRYDRTPRMPFPVIEPVEESQEPLMPELAVFDEMMLEIYYDDTSMW